jgi:F0F1-type ATP synthase membrane subunit b/b'
MIVENIILSGQIAGAIGAIIGTILLILKYAFYKPLVKIIKDVTRQIQPDANGGKSLADVALGVARVERKVENVIKRVENLEESLSK